MDGQLLKWLYQRLIRDDSLGHTRGCTYSDGLICLIGLFAVHDNRSLRWASSASNWPLWCRSRRRRWPSYSQLVRRSKTRAVIRLLREINAQLVDRLSSGNSDSASSASSGSSSSSNTLAGDGLALTVGGYSKDADARRGYVPGGGKGRGYKLHAIADAVTRVIHAAAIAGLNRGESIVMARLARLTPMSGRLLRADSNYDTNRLYGAVAARGGRLIANLRRPGTRLGHRPQHPDRRATHQLLNCDRAAARLHRRERSSIERCFAHLRAAGLFALPPFVRRRRRVKRWVRAKLLLYHLSLMLRREKS
jgi:hypothetical protein